MSDDLTASTFADESHGRGCWLPVLIGIVFWAAVGGWLFVAVLS